MSAKIILSDLNLKYLGKEMPGIPIVLIDGKVALLESFWLVTLSADRLLSPHTTMAYARAIGMWRISLDAARIQWDAADGRNLVLWRDAQLEHGVDPKTVNLRLTAVAEFYRWCHAEGLLDRIALRVSSHRAKRGAAVAVREIAGGTVTKASEAVRRKKTFTDEQFLAVRAANPRVDRHLRMRDDCMFRWGWCAGLRRAEIVSITLDQIASSLGTRKVDPNDLLGRLHLSRQDAFVLSLDPASTKGGKGGDILVPRALMKQTLEWAATGRARILGKCRDAERAGGHVFIGMHGNPVPPETLTHTFSVAAKRAGAKGRLHATRHSFATRLVAAAESLGSKDGLRLAKELLRHSDERTTKEYAHMIESRQDRVVLSMLVARLDADAVGLVHG